MSETAMQIKEAPDMVRNPNILFLYQAFLAFLAVTLASVGFVTAWMLLYLQGSGERRGPGINLREL